MRGSVGEYLAMAPVAFAVTRGPTHELVHANPIFQPLILTGEITLSDDGGNGSRPAANLTPLLDRVFSGAGTVFDEILEPAGVGSPRLSCTVWPVLGGNETPEGLVIEIRDI